MRTIYLLKTGEISLKGDNRVLFEKRLFSNIKKQLHPLRVRISGKSGRFYLQSLGNEDQNEKKRITDTLRSVFGLVGFATVLKTGKILGDIEKAVIDTAEKQITRLRDNDSIALGFKINAKRADKSFRPESYELCCMLGDLIKGSFSNLEVNLKKPDFSINVEIREKALIYSEVTKSPGGLPCGSAGKSLLLLSGGIDSPVAGYLMAKRGCSIEAVHFDTYPFTSTQSREKVIKIAEKMAQYLPEMRLHIVPFTDTQVFIKQNCAENEITLFSRAAMMEIAHRLSAQINAKSITTGECLSQVASQTAENIRFTGSMTDYPVLRPLIGMDKEEIIIKAREIGTFDLSILPYPDCCSVFAPSRPLTKPLFSKITKAYREIDLSELLEKALSNIETLEIRKDTGIQ